VFTHLEFAGAVAKEAELLEQQMEALFPGYRASDEGMVITPAVAAETNRIRGFPP
jgi:hypothetical protein